MAAIALALTLKSHNSVSSGMSLVPPEPLLSLHQSPGGVLANEKSVCGPFKKTPGFPAALCLTQTDGISTDFHSQMLQGLLFLALVLQDGDPGVRLGTLIFQGKSL